MSYLSELIHSGPEINQSFASNAQLRHHNSFAFRMVTPPGEGWIHGPFRTSSMLSALWIRTDAVSNVGKASIGWPGASDAEVASSANQFLHFMVRRLQHLDGRYTVTQL